MLPLTAVSHYPENPRYHNRKQIEEIAASISDPGWTFMSNWGYDPDDVDSEGDIDMGLYEPATGRWWVGDSMTDHEALDAIISESGGTCYIAIWGEDAGNYYNLWWDDVEP